MFEINLNKPLKFNENLRVEPPNTNSGYNWGKKAGNSNILNGMKQYPHSECINKFSLSNDHIISERWFTSDDRTFPSSIDCEGKAIPFYEILGNWGKEILGERHLAEFGPFISSIMKQIDTNKNPKQGSLSTQVHPKDGFAGLPAKPEMWLGSGKVYLGWNQIMTEELISQAVKTHSLEKYMNSFDITPEDYYIVPGGSVHAIRYNTFIYEWSKSPAKDDFGKGDLKNATIALYDCTDGKSPRKGKENLDIAFKVMTHADTFNENKNFKSPPHEIYKDNDKNSINLIFNTPYVVVEKHEIKTRIEMDTIKRGFPIFLEKGKIQVIKDNSVIDEILGGEERFFPALLGKFTLCSIDKDKNAVLYKWYRPFLRT